MIFIADKTASVTTEFKNNPVLFYVFSHLKNASGDRLCDKSTEKKQINTITHSYLSILGRVPV